MPNTVRAKLLLGWMTQHEALTALRSCVFDSHLGRRSAISIWREYRDRVLALDPRRPEVLPQLPLGDSERQAVEEHTRRIRGGPNARYFSGVVKIHPGNLLAKQFHVLIDRSAQYGLEMSTEASRTNYCLGVGLDFTGQLVFRQANQRLIRVDLPHPEFVILPAPNGFNFKERDRYVTLVPTPDGRLLLWGGYHRTHAVLCHMAGDAEGAAPVLTVMSGIPEVDAFFARPSPTRDTILGDRPALLRDFLDESLFMVVNLRKKRAEGRIEQLRPGKFRAGIFLVNDDS